MTAEEIGIVEAEVNFLESLALHLQERAKELRETAQRLTKEAEKSRLVSQVENLPFVEARSGKCYWIKGDEVPQELKDLVSSGKDGLKTEKHHYTLTKDGNVLRFDRHKEDLQK